MLDLDTIAAKFLSVLSPRLSAESRERVGRALQIIFDGHREGSIFNVDYKDAKDRLSRVADDAWEVRMQNRYATGSGLGTPEARVVYDITIMGLHDCIAGQKKLAKLIAAEKPSAAFQEEAYAFFDATVPVALLVKGLKSKVVMGRKPNPEATARREAINLKKIVRTCPVCLRGIGVVRGLIADHGYHLPHRGWKTSSCPGEHFPPLEESPKGVEHMVGLLTQWLGEYERQLAQAPSITSITREKPHSFRGEKETITPGSPQWQNAYDRYVEGLKGDIRATKSSLAEFQRRLASWKPTPEGKRYSGGKRRHAQMHGVSKLHSEVRGLLRK
jgi:hypothetical protein